MYRLIFDINLIENYVPTEDSPLKKGYILIKGDFFFFSTDPISTDFLSLSYQDFKDYIIQKYPTRPKYFILSKIDSINFNQTYGSIKNLINTDIHSQKEKKCTEFKENIISPTLLNYNTYIPNLIGKFGAYILISIFIFLMIESFKIKAYYGIIVIISLPILLAVLGGIFSKIYLKFIYKNIKKELLKQDKLY